MALTDNLVAYWTLDEASGTRNDSVGSNHLTDNNTVASATGKISNAADFEFNNSEYLSLADNTDLSVGDIDFTWTCWVNAESLPGGLGVLGKWASSNEYAIFHLSSRFKFSVQDSSSTQGTATANNLGAPSTATWYFIAAWHDSVANTINIQGNDGTVDSTSWTTGVRDGTNTFSIGDYQHGAGATFWDGLVDEVGFWKRVLTSGERTQLYNSGAGLAYSSFGAAFMPRQQRPILQAVNRAASY